ncbi:MAG: hypothetical protein AAF627_11910 [Myxococcota bacterium]
MSAGKSSRSASRKSSKKKTKPTAGAFLNRIADYAEGQHPLHVYLSGLSPSSARVTETALESIADILSNGRRTAEDLAWHLIRAQHVATLRGRLQKLYAPATRPIGI